MPTEVSNPGEKHFGILRSEGSPTLLGSMSFGYIHSGGMFYHRDKEVKLDEIL